MVQCTTCGSLASEVAGKCSNCGTILNPPANGASALSDETVAIPAAEASRPPSRTSTTVSRLTTTSVPDEGRFPAGTLVGGRYRVIALLGRGGMGEVYRATDLTLGQSVALKFLPEEAAGNERLLERFHNEVRTARQVSHSNVCRVYDIGEADGLPFISMEYVDGEDLASLLQRIGRLSAGKALEITRKLCAGLAAAHERGIMHRDLKPQNIMLNKRGEVIIMDFGLAAIADHLEGTEARTGTPAYMAPEQLRGDSVTAKSDIYSLGLIAYELFTGNRAFEATSVADLLRAQESSRPVSIVSVAADVDPVIERVIMRCLHPDPAHRPPNPLAISAALPGGDALAAALAAGETPSPELVAASGKTHGFKLRYAAPCLAFVLLGLLATPFVEQPMSMLAVSPIDYSPEVLQNKAYEIAAAVGYPAKPADWTNWFSFNSGLTTYFKSHSRGGKSWAQIYDAESPINFEYRQSPSYLLSPPDGDIDMDRPPMTLPGMVSVRLDSRGRLRQFRAVAPREDKGGSTQPLDPALVFRQAGLDLSQFHEVTPVYTPPVPFDARRAWSAAYPGLPGVSVTAELATWHGALTSFNLQWPWTKFETGGVKPPRLKDTITTLIPVLMICFLLISIAVIARSNLRRDRGDRQGAFRLAAAGLVIFVFVAFVNFHLVPDFAVLGFAFNNLAVGLGLCGILWLFYIALEPMIRARWPHSLITWNRLMAGQIRDPRLASHILIGVVIGMAIRFGLLWRDYWLAAAGDSPVAPELSFLNGVRPMFNHLGNTVGGALQIGIIVFFLICGVRALLRNDWLAVGVSAVLMTLVSGSLQNSAHPFIDVPINLALWSIFSFVLLRMGLVPTMVSVFVINAMGAVWVGSEFSAWYNYAPVLYLSLIGALAIFAFLRSQAQVQETPLLTSTTRHTWA
ncbi:MAG TPA: serine/threonine-protein kinase [Bryobacteraceae bacterium]|nr:serine/threonine-protein kinase [Bryobacteraceae bacterium]